MLRAIVSLGLVAILVSSATIPAPTYSSWTAPIKYTPGPSAVLPICSTECRKNCTQGLEVCIGMRSSVDTATAKLNPDDPNFYVYCACQKSTIVRAPGVYCGPGTGVDRVPIPCPSSSYWVDGFNTTVPKSQGTVVENLKASGVTIVG